MFVVCRLFLYVGTIIPSSQEPSFSCSVLTGTKLSSELEIGFLFNVHRCWCLNSSFICVVRAEECQFCMEVNKCIERMEEVEKDC